MSRTSRAPMAFLLGIGVLACSRTPPEQVTDPKSISASAIKKCPRPLSPTAPAEQKPVPAEKCPKDPEFSSMLRLASLSFETGADVASSVTVEIAKTQPEHQKGLMYRMDLSEDRGMLFVMDEKTDHTFWMRNTCIPLDMVFIDSDGTIVGILEQVPPMNEELRSVGCASSFVLELKAGYSRRHQVRPGQKVVLPKV